MSEGGSLNNAVQMATILLSLTPFPGLGAVAITLQEIYKLVQRVSFRKQECEALCEYSLQVLMVIRDHYNPAFGTKFDRAIADVTNVCAQIEEDVKRWGNYGKGMGYLKNAEMMDRIADNRKRLSQAMGMLNLAHTLGQEDWNTKFQQAQERDHTMMEEIVRKQDRMNENVEQLQRIILSQRNNTYDPEVPQARQELFTLRNGRMDSAVLPKADLQGEVSKIGARPAHAGTAYDVWKGLWLNEYFVALKVFRGVNPRTKDTERMNRQIDLWRTLKHRNILRLYGIVQLDNTANPPVYFVSPWMKNRDVITYCKSNPKADRLKLIYDIAMGLKYLHSVNILHGGLQGSNVLVAIDGSAVLSDFSLSKILDGAVMFTQSNGPSASLRWMSPEAHNAELMTSQSDVYAWGMTALQVLSGQIPFYKIKAMGQLVVNIAIKSIKPKREDYATEWMTDRLWNLIYSCWDIEPLRRPTIAQVIAELAQVRFERDGWKPEEDDDDEMMEQDPMDMDYPQAF